jgi:hypothetical protein
MAKALRIVATTGDSQVRFLPGAPPLTSQDGQQALDA